MCQTAIVIICGPTASGKSMLGLELAEALDGEIVSADSMQVYAGMDVGTDKPTSETRQRVPHHMIDVVRPDEPFDAARYREVASGVIQRICDAGKRAFVVGGTGLYLRALVYGLFPCPPVPQEIRMELREEVLTKGVSQLYEELTRVDKATAGKVHPNDTIRIIRALEVHRGTGRPISEFQQAHGFSHTAYRVLKLAIDTERGELYQRIEARVDQMIERGLIEEVKLLFNLGYGRSLRPMQSIGYRQIGEYLFGELSLNQAVERIKRDSRHYAKRQWTWFRADREVCWLKGRTPGLEAFRRVKNFLKV